MFVNYCELHISIYLTHSLSLSIYIYKLNLEGIQYDMIDTSSFMLYAIFSKYFLPTK